MIVCNCHRVTERQIASAMAQGATSLSDIQKELNVGTNCGSCLEHAQLVMQQNGTSWPSFNYNLATQLS